MLRLIGFALLALAFSSHAAITEEEVSYKDGDTVMKGVLFYDDAVTEKLPGMVVVHEWWGLTKHMRDTARAAASMGYVAFAADMFGNGTTTDDAKTGGQLAGAVGKNPALSLSRFNAARAVLAGNSRVDSSRIGAMGFCFGANVALNAARGGSELAGVAAFHASNFGTLPVQPGAVKAKLLVLHGAADAFVKPEAIETFKKDMDGAKVDYRFISYPGALHAFTNPAATEAGKKFNIPLAYNAQADRQSRGEALKFFGEVFGGRP